jgi:hypothetical protein
MEGEKTAMLDALSTHPCREDTRKKNQGEGKGEEAYLELMVILIFLVFLVQVKEKYQVDQVILMVVFLFFQVKLKLFLLLPPKSLILLMPP